MYASANSDTWALDASTGAEVWHRITALYVSAAAVANRILYTSVVHAFSLPGTTAAEPAPR